MTRGVLKHFCILKVLCMHINLFNLIQMPEQPSFGNAVFYKPCFANKDTTLGQPKSRDVFKAEAGV